MVRQTASLIFLEILGGMILLVLVAAGLLAARLYSGPMDLSMFQYPNAIQVADSSNTRHNMCIR